MKTVIAATRSGSATHSAVRIDDQIYRVGAAVVGISACAIGIWAAACAVAGLIASGGPLGLIVNWLNAVSVSL